VYPVDRRQKVWQDAHFLAAVSEQTSSELVGHYFFQHFMCTVTSARDLSVVSIAFLVSRVGRRSPQLARRCELNSFVQRPVQWAAHSVNAVRTLDRFSCRFRRLQLHSHVNAPNDEHALLRFHLSRYVRGQFRIAGIDLARFQRASKSTHHSTGGRRNDIVNG